MPAKQIGALSQALPSSLNDQSRAQGVQRYPPWVSASRHQDLTIQTLNKGKGRSHSHWPQFQSSKPFPLWCYGLFPVLALVHTAKYIQSLHCCTCQNRSLWYVSCYYGNFIVTGVHTVSLTCTHTARVVIVQQFLSPF